MNISIELSPVIENQLRSIAAKYQLDVHAFAAQAIQNILAHSVKWEQESQPGVEAMLENLASDIHVQQEQARAAQKAKNVAAIALLRSWREEDANVSSEERETRLAEGKALEAGMAAHPFTLKGELT